MQLDDLVAQKNHHLPKPPHVLIQTSHQPLGGFSKWWFFCATRWSNWATNLILLSNWTAFQQKNIWWSLINEGVVLNKQTTKMCSLIWTTQGFSIVFKFLFVSNTLRLLEPLSPRIKKEKTIYKINLKNNIFNIFGENEFLGGPTSTT